jgi:hypothetical protein
VVHPVWMFDVLADGEKNAALAAAVADAIGRKSVTATSYMPDNRGVDVVLPVFDVQTDST